MRKLLFLLVAIVFFSCNENNSSQTSVRHIISPDPSVVVKFTDYADWRKTLSSQALLSKYKKEEITNELWMSNLEGFDTEKLVNLD